MLNMPVVESAVTFGILTTPDATVKVKRASLYVDQRFPGHPTALYVPSTRFAPPNSVPVPLPATKSPDEVVPLRISKYAF